VSLARIAEVSREDALCATAAAGAGLDRVTGDAGVLGGTLDLCGSGVCECSCEVGVHVFWLLSVVLTHQTG